MTQPQPLKEREMTQDERIAALEKQVEALSDQLTSLGIAISHGTLNVEALNNQVASMMAAVTEPARELRSRMRASIGVAGQVYASDLKT